MDIGSEYGFLGDPKEVRLRETRNVIDIVVPVDARYLWEEVPEAIKDPKSTICLV